MSTVYYTVVKGDNLTKIAKAYNTTVNNLVKLNNIKNPNYIVVGQKLIISGASSSSSSTSSNSSSSSSTVDIYAFGLQSNTNRTLYAAWNWNRTYTDHYNTIWYYDSGDGVWFIGNESQTSDTQSLYDIPDKAIRVKFIVKPYSETYTSNDTQVHYWTANWSTAKFYDVDSLPPSVPSAPKVTIDGYTLTCSLDNIDNNTTAIEFSIVQNDQNVYMTGQASVITNAASYSCTVTAGEKYKVRARAIKNSIYSGWSDYTSNVVTTPSAPTHFITCKAMSKSSVLLSWPKVNAADTYTIEYSEKREYLEGGSNAITAVASIETAQYHLTGLESGKRYYFRVKAVNTQGSSGWSEISSCILGTTPAAPTTWSSTSTAIVGEALILYWIHNAEDGSSQTKAEIEVYVNNTKNTYVVNTPNQDDKNETNQYSINTKTYPEGATIKWRVRTAGITETYGDWSVQRTISLYAPPTLQLAMTDNNGSTISILESFPFYIKAIPGPATQVPISYYVTIISNGDYDTIDEVGVIKRVRVGDEVYSQYYNTNQTLLLKLSADSVDLENNIDYTIKVLVTMNSGLTTETRLKFTVAWTDPLYFPNAEIAYDPRTYTTSIRPFCGTYDMEYYKVLYRSGRYLATEERIDPVEGISVDGAFTKENDIVYLSQNDMETMFILRQSTIPRLIPGIKLSVYRREYDGKFVEIGSGLDNTKNTFVTDPHPSLDFARYRVIAIDEKTGGVSYTDLSGYPINEKSVILQWDETWRSFDVTDDAPTEEPRWSGSLISIPYNINVSDNNTNDVSLANYIGRSHPVSYYGTHVGYKSTWSMVIPKSDKETLYALRRLAIWLGDVYVREPSGSGYWATISVSFSQSYDNLTIPINLDITRVEGGK